MSSYCSQKGIQCEFANLNGYCQNTACTKSFSITYEAYGMKPLTNADKIRSMSDEELAEWLIYKVKCTGCNAENCNEEFCLNSMKEWIKCPYEET